MKEGTDGGEEEWEEGELGEYEWPPEREEGVDVGDRACLEEGGQ